MSIKKIFSLFLTLALVFVMAVEGIAEVASEQESMTGQMEESTEQKETTEAAGETGQANLGLTSKSAILLEASTGTVIYEHNPDEKLSPASITKIMTLILIFDAINDGKITMQDNVTTSEYAKSMGGSQVFLEEGETQTVDTLIKCIIVASGNDASVAMAEYISGSETEFVAQMNKRAEGLGMTSTHFEDCCGLTESDNHYTSARDVAIMSRELITKYPQIFDYSGIWMDTITHKTEKGESEFGLANTNKLLKQYEWATGLKTGSTSKAKYCLSATARKDNIDMIAVIMAAPDYKARFKEAVTLLNYGYANCKIYRSINDDKLKKLEISGGTDEKLECEYTGDFSYLSTTGENVESIEKKILLNEELTAPVKKGDVVGKAEYYLGEKLVGSVDIVAKETIKKAGFKEYLKKALDMLWL